MVGKWNWITGILFYIGLSLEIACVVIDKSSVTNPYQSMMFRAAFVLFVIRFFARIRDFDRRELLVACFFFVISVICWRVSGRNELIRFLAFVLALRTVQIRTAAVYTFYTTLAGCIGIVVLSLTGVMGNLYVTANYKYGGGIETRWNLGFGHPNSLHCMALMLMLLFMVLYDEHMTVATHLILMAGNALLYGLTGSNTGFLVASGALILSLLLHSKKHFRGDFLYRAGEVLLVGGLLFSVFAATHDPRDAQWVMDLDNIIFSGRIYGLWQTVFHEGTISTWKWFGSHFNTYYFDLGWVRLVYWYGIIPAVILVILTFALLEYTRKTRDKGAYVMLISMALYTVFEAHLVSEFIGRNYALFLAAAIVPKLLNKNNSKTKEENKTLCHHEKVDENDIPGPDQAKQMIQRRS